MHPFEAQKDLFSEKLSRLALAKVAINKEKHHAVSINIWRNHGFEALLPLMRPYFEFSGWDVDFNIGGYDDSILFTDWCCADVEILWIDSSRLLKSLSFSSWIIWLEGRLKELRNYSDAPIILATWAENRSDSKSITDLADRFPSVYFADLSALCSDQNVQLIDLRTQGVSGTPIGNHAQLHISRKLSCHWLPAVLCPPIKAVAVDLDNTLHEGVLGEDGISGVVLSSSHRDFQLFLRSLQQRGVFIALVSRNEQGDVKTLFEQRRDYPLKWEDFSAIEVSWGSKADALVRMADVLRIAPDAILFVDDNIGELANVSGQIPSMHQVFAYPDASLTERSVLYHPGIWRWKTENEDIHRVRDLRSNTARDDLAKTLSDPLEYFRSLGVTLTYWFDEKEQLARLADLCGKTNQFNMALKRLSQTEISQRMKSESMTIASVQLKDKFSESGVIAIISGRRVDGVLFIDELCISCRALGRRLEDAIVLHSIRNMKAFSGCKTVSFSVNIADRNQPAITWLANLLALDGEPKEGMVSCSIERVIDFKNPEGVIVSIGSEPKDESR